MDAGRQFWRQWSFADPSHFQQRDQIFLKDPLRERLKALRDLRDDEPCRSSEPLERERGSNHSRRRELSDSLSDERRRFQEGHRAIPRAHQPSKGSSANRTRLHKPTQDQLGPSPGSGLSSNSRPLLTRGFAQFSVPTSATTYSKASESRCVPSPDFKTQTCVACAEDLPLAVFSESPLTQTCNHTNSSCNGCVKQWIETRLSNGTWDDIKCLECDEMMQYTDVQRHADTDVFRKYDNLAAMSWLNHEEEFVWCRNQGCGSGQLHVGGQNSPRFRCVSCKSQYCIQHEVPWHEGETCTDFDTRMNGMRPVGIEGSVTPQGSPYFHNGQQPRRRRSSMCVYSNNRQERRLFDEARARRAMAENPQLQPNNNGSQSMQDDVEYAWSHTIDSTDAWGRWLPPGYMPRPSMEWAPQVSAARAAMSPASAESMMGNETQLRQFWHDRTRVCPDVPLHDQHGGYAVSTAFPRSRGLARDMPVRGDHHDIYDRQLQMNFDEVGEEAVMVPRAMRFQREQSTRDAATARALHHEIRREEHDRQEREAYHRRKADEKEGERTVKANAKQCPKCRWFIQKSIGCDHMTCFKCKYEFCWLCLADYQRIRDDGNSAHKPGCRDYRRG